MKKMNRLEFATGFMLGALPLGFLEGALLFIHNALLSAWFGWARLQPAWWLFIPLPLISGFLMGKAIASLHLEDY